MNMNCDTLSLFLLPKDDFRAGAVNAGSGRSPSRPSRRRTKRHASAFAETRPPGLAGNSI
jgi:hypothetical protein